jgi:uncharacterized protein (DUF2344 family)
MSCSKSATQGTLTATGANYWIQTANIGIGTAYNVGIGSLVPGQALDVNGTERINSTTHNVTFATNSTNDINILFIIKILYRLKIILNRFTK